MGAGVCGGGAGSVTFHVEAAHAPIRLARALRSAGARAGMALKPATAIEPYADMLSELDMVLLMTVEPGFGGQSFLDVVVPKIARTRELLGPDSDVWLQVDGGIDDTTVEIAAEAGANVFVVTHRCTALPIQLPQSTTFGPRPLLPVGDPSHLAERYDVSNRIRRS